MDSLVVNELASHYESRVLKFTPKIFTAFGIGRNSVSLELGGPAISCIPYEFSIPQARLLAVLNNDEVAHFLEQKTQSSKLVLVRKTGDQEKPEVFHIPVRLQGFQRPNEESNYCLVNLQFVRLPHEIKELLVTYFFQADQADAFVANLKDVPFEEDDIRSIFKSLYLSLLKESSREAERLKILSYTAKKVRLFGEFTGAHPTVGEKLDFQPFRGDQDCLVTGTCSVVKAFPELPGFLLLEVDQTLTLEVVKKLMKFAKTAKTGYLNLP